MALWYIDSSKTGGSNNGTSRANAWLAFSSIGTNAAPGDIILVYRGTGSAYAKWTVAESGSSATARIMVKGVDEGSGKPVIVGIDCGSFDYGAIIGLEITQSSAANNYPAINFAGSVGWLVQDNYIHDTYGAGIGCTNGTVNSNNIIRANLFEDISSVGGGSSGGSPVIFLIGDANLVEYNSVTLGLDRVNVFGVGNVIRNNYWGPTDTTNYPNTSPYPYHTDTLQTYEGKRATSQLLYEANYSADNTDSVGGTNAHWLNIQDGSAGSENFNWFLLRQNIDLRTGGSHLDFIATNRVYEFNSTVVGSLSGDPTTTNTPCFWHGSPTSDTAGIFNNAWYNNPRCLDSGGIYGASYRPTNFTSGANFSFNPGGGSQPVLPTGASPANLSNTDPVFVNPASDDYRPDTGSPLIATAAPITAAVGAAGGGSSTSLTVVDAKRLFDGQAASGWAAADADYIKIGSGAYVQISSINYATNVVTLGAARNWADGDGVAVRGTVDVGALPHGSAAPSILSGGVTSLAGSASVTVADSFNVRFVEILVDGIPVGSSYAPSGNVFTVTWTGDGSASHTFTARAYAKWANASPTTEIIVLYTGGQIPIRSAIYAGKTVMVTAS